MSLQELKQGFAVSDIAMVVVRTASKSYAIKTAIDAEFKAAIDPGQEKPLRKKNNILALSKTKDLVKGYDVTFTDVLVHPEILGIIEGGVVTQQPEGTFKSFSGPIAGSPVTRESFGLDIYSENVDTSGEVSDYMKFSLEKCTGTPTEFTLKDGDFFTPKFKVESRPAKGQAIIGVERVTTLPNVE